MYAILSFKIELTPSDIIQLEEAAKQEGILSDTSENEL